MEMRAGSSRRLCAASLLALVAVASFASATASARASAVAPAQLYRALLKGPAAASLPPALRGSTTKATKLSTGSKAHHAVGAVEIGNTAAIVGFLVFPTHALALADLKAYPPNTGPNKIVTARPAGLPRPAYILRAIGNGYEVAYAVFVLDNVVVNAWTYGPKGTTRTLTALVQRNARWAKGYGLSAIHGTK